MNARTPLPIDRIPRHEVAPVTDADFRWLVESVVDYAIFLLDTEGRIRSWNEGARRLYGYDPEEVVGRADGDSLGSIRGQAAER